MKENQRWLQSLGLVNPQVEALCSIADSAGASGTKVTGAGGGGCVIALAPDRGADILNAWQHAGFKGFFVNAGV
jgi:mevalonate kinase